MCLSVALVQEPAKQESAPSAKNDAGSVFTG
jgi:hypothetical protein